VGRSCGDDHATYGQERVYGHANASQGRWRADIVPFIRIHSNTYELLWECKGLMEYSGKHGITFDTVLYTGLGKYLSYLKAGGK
jgi:hypothetical protein